MKLWKPSTARISQKMPLISAHHSARRRAPRAAADSSIAAPARASSVSNANSSAIYSSLLRDRFDDHEGLRPGVRSEEHTSELQSLMRISYAVFCLKKKKIKKTNTDNTKIPYRQTV